VRTLTARRRRMAEGGENLPVNSARTRYGPQKAP
jgi:hypothetical protein